MESFGWDENQQRGNGAYMRRFVVLGSLMWIGGAALVVIAVALLFYLYHATGLAILVASIILP